MSDTKNTRNAALLISEAGAGSWTKINKTHGLRLGTPTDMAEDTGHGQRFKTRIPGLQDFTLTVAAWYRSLSTLLDYISINRVSYFFLLYHDYADSLNYYRGKAYMVKNSLNLDLGNAADEEYELVLADENIQVVRAGSAL